jgi:DNA-binding CsgD family transcriptional regulator
VYDLALVAAEDAGAATGIVGLGTQKAWMFTRLGRLPEALDLFATSAGLVDVVPYAEGYVLVGQAYVLLLMGRLDESEALCQQAESIGTRRGQTNVLIFLHEVRGHRALREGRTLDAAAQYAALEEFVHRTGLREPCLGSWARHAVSAYLACNQAPEAQRLVAWLEGCSKDLPCTWPQIAAATARALLAWHEGDHGAADAEFQRALSLHRVGEQPVEEAQSLLEYGTFLRRTGRRVRARPLLARALELAEASSAHWIAGFVRAELNAAGGRRRKQQPPDLLTAQEGRVAELAAAGLSNREMSAQLSLSNATIETHLQRVYSKLDIHSRRELMLKAQAAGGSVL